MISNQTNNTPKDRPTLVAGGYPVDSVECLLCGSRNIKEIETITTTDIHEIYSKSLNLDVAKEFKGVARIKMCECLSCRLLFYTPPAAGSGEFYDLLQAQSWYYKEEKREFEYARRFVKEGESVLEVGGGAGAFARSLNKGSYLGLELSGKAIERAREGGIKMVQTTVQDYADRNPEEHDVVCAFQVLEHISQPRSFLESCVRCLKPGGKLIISVPSADSFLILCRNNATNLPPHHVTLWKDEAFQSVARELSLNLLQTIHDPASDQEMKWLATALIDRTIHKMINRKWRFVELGLVQRVISKVANRLSKPLSCALHGLGAISGASVTAVYEKPGV